MLPRLGMNSVAVIIDKLIGGRNGHRLRLPEKIGNIRRFIKRAAVWMVDFGMAALAEKLVSVVYQFLFVLCVAVLVQPGRSFFNADTATGTRRISGNPM